MADTEQKGVPFSRFKTDTKKEEEGVWVKYEGGVSLKIARLNNPKYKEYSLKRSKPHLRRLQAGTIDGDVAEDIMKDAIANTVLLDWKGLLDEKGNEIPFSQEKAREQFDEAHDFYTEVFNLCQQRELFSIEDEEGAEKNS